MDRRTVYCLLGLGATCLGVALAVLCAPNPAAAEGPATPNAGHDAGVVALHRTAATAGFLAYGLMVGTMAFGLLTSTGLARRSIKRQTLYGAHMTMAIMTVSFVMIHVVGNVFHPGADVSAVQAVVPFLGGSPLGVSTGVVGAELVVATAISVWFQRQLSYRVWQRLHWLAYPAFGLALLHTVVSGSDVHGRLVVATLSATAVVVASLFVLRALPATSLVRTRVGPVEP